MIEEDTHIDLCPLHAHGYTRTQGQTYTHGGGGGERDIRLQNHRGCQILKSALFQSLEPQESSGVVPVMSSDIPQLKMQDINNQLKAARQEEFIGVQ